MKLKQILRKYGVEFGMPVRFCVILRRDREWTRENPDGTPAGSTMEVSWSAVPLGRWEKGVVTGARRIYSGRIEPLEWGGDMAFIAEEQGYAIEVRTGWLNRPVLLLPNMVERLDEPFELPILHCHWSPGELAARRKDVKDWPRDEKGRFC